MVLPRQVLEWGGRLLRCLPPEFAHDLTLNTLASKQGPSLIPPFLLDSPAIDLTCKVPGIGILAHPVGLAAGFDKNARALPALARLGFSFIEIGTVTPRPQGGNPKPRVFRFPASRSLVNRLGFPNQGIAGVYPRLAQVQSAKLANGPMMPPIGINVGKNKETSDDNAHLDYIDCIKSLGEYGQYLVINISSPNTPGLRGLTDSAFLRLVAHEIGSDRARCFVKLDPDMARDKFQRVVAEIVELGYQGVILTNTHKVDEPQVGGLSGQPLASLALSRLEWAHEVHNGRLVMIASGGIFSGLDVLERVRRGASAVQIYTSLIYRGPFAVGEILAELQAELRLRGIPALSQALGTYYAERH